MQIPYSELPGRHERHYRRKIGNPLFARPSVVQSDPGLLDVQRLDNEELLDFIVQLRAAVAQAVELKPTEESQVVLDLKERFDKLYETAAGLGDDQSGNQHAIRQLLAVIMRTVRVQAAGDPLADAELGQEERARTAHFALLSQPLVADILHPESVIAKDELVATLLSESEIAVAAALELFDERQLRSLCADAQGRVAELEADGIELPDARQRLSQMRGRLAPGTSSGRPAPTTA